MGMLPRWIKADTVYSEVQRTVDRQFLFKPDPAICNIIGASAARAQQKFPIHLYWLEFNINHEQTGVAPLSNAPEHLNAVVKWKQLYHRLLAEEVNRLLEREGSLFSTASRSTECVDDRSLEQQFYYALTNPVKDGLVEHILEWKGFSSYDVLASGKEKAFVYFDRTAWNKKGGHKKKVPIQQFAKQISIVYSPLPSLAKLPLHQQQARIRKEVKALEASFSKERAALKQTAMGPQKLDQVNHRDRPKQAAKRTRKPLCHASTREAAADFEEKLNDFLIDYRAASAQYLAGNFYIEFPTGSFRPPLICVYTPM